MNKGTFGAFSGRRKRQALVPIWESPDTGVLALGSNFSWSHSLNFRPKLFTFGLRCLTADGNYPVGAEIDRITCVDSVGGSTQMICHATPLVITIFSAVDTRFEVASGTSAAAAKTLVVGSWRPFARIFG